MALPKRRKVQFQLPEALYDKMAFIAADLGCSMNAWAIRALAYAAKNHMPLDDYINQAPTRGRGRGKAKQSYKRLTPFNNLPVDSLGWPHGLPPYGGETVVELRRKLEEAGEEGVKRVMGMIWAAEQLGEYTDEHLAETLRQLDAGDE